MIETLDNIKDLIESCEIKQQSIERVVRYLADTADDGSVNAKLTCNTKLLAMLELVSTALGDLHYCLESIDNEYSSLYAKMAPAARQCTYDGRKTL